MRRDANPAAWNIGRAMLYGAILGVAAAGFKLMAPESVAPGSFVSWGEARTVGAMAREIVGAGLAFALFCGIVAAARNFVIGRLIGPKA